MAMEFVAKGFAAVKEVDRVIDYAERNDKRLIPLLRVILMPEYEIRKSKSILSFYVEALLFEHLLTLRWRILMLCYAHILFAEMVVAWPSNSEIMA